MATAISETDAGILMEFRATAQALRDSFVAENTHPLERQPRINAMVKPYLKRLAENGWSQRDRMIVLVEIWAGK